MQRGFTLVELAIVLVILGLLVGGILTGQSLIYAAELRRVATQLTSTQTAMNTFRDKYFALPGDMTNAFAFWGTAAGCTNTSVLVAPYDGCNGDGNGQIVDNATNGGEDLRAFQFLAMAGLIEGSYTGLPEATGNKRKGGINIIKAPYRNAVLWLNELSTPQFTYTGNNLIIGNEGAITPGAAALTPEDQWNIDSKLDDGKANSGIITPMESQTTCYGTTNYTLTNTSVVCTLAFWLR